MYATATTGGNDNSNANNLQEKQAKKVTIENLKNGNRRRLK